MHIIICVLPKWLFFFSDYKGRQYLFIIDIADKFFLFFVAYLKYDGKLYLLKSKKNYNILLIWELILQLSDTEKLQIIQC